MELSISTEVGANAHVVSVGGDLDVYTAPRLKAALDGLGPDGATIVLDLTGVHFIDSTALGVLVASVQQARAAGGDLCVVTDDPHLLKIFRITGFESVFRMFSGVVEALEAV